jgi:Triosephosphate isomerase
MITPETSGAFTGGIAPVMLKSMGIEWALAGHSERRTINKETDQYINAQCKLLIAHDMNVVLCIGETLEEFEKDLVGPVCEIQLKKGLAGVDKKDMDNVVMGYWNWKGRDTRNCPRCPQKDSKHFEGYVWQGCCTSDTSAVWWISQS